MRACLRACLRAGVRAGVRAFVCPCVRACVRACVYVSECTVRCLSVIERVCARLGVCLRACVYACLYVCVRRLRRSFVCRWSTMSRISCDFQWVISHRYLHSSESDLMVYEDNVTRAVLRLVWPSILLQYAHDC